MRLMRNDFLDFGASKGGCIDFAVARLGGKRGLGIDNDPAKVQRMRDLGYDCLRADILNLDLPENSVRFVTMSHFLEHLHDLDAVRKAIECAARTAQDFLFIQGPYFDADGLLRDRGLKFYWSDWHGHRCHLTITDLQVVLNELALGEYLVMGRTPVADSLDPSIHPLASPRDQHDYVAEVHPPKPWCVFDPPLFKEIVCLVRLRCFRRWERVVRARRGCYFIDGTLQFTPERGAGNHDGKASGGKTGVQCAWRSARRGRDRA